MIKISYIDMKGLGELKPVYDFLQDRPGEYFSPEEIAKELHSDVTTIKKQLDELKEMHAIQYKNEKYCCFS